MAAEIAVVSFERFLHGDEADRQAVAKEIYDAFSTVGWVYVKDHGIPQERVDEIFEWVMSHLHSDCIDYSDTTVIGQEIF